MPVSMPRFRHPTFSEATCFKEAPAREGCIVSVGLCLMVVPTEDRRCSAVVDVYDAAQGVHHLVEGQARLDGGIFDFLEDLAPLRERYPGARWSVIEAPGQSGLGYYLVDHPKGVPELEVQNTSELLSLGVRMLPYAEDWRAGRVLVPAGPAVWVSELIGEQQRFDGMHPGGLLMAAAAAHWGARAED